MRREKREMNVTFKDAGDEKGLAVIRALAGEVWPVTFRPILPPEQIPYMMEMMYAPEVQRREVAEGVRFEVVRVDGEAAGYLSWSVPGKTSGTADLHKVYLLPKWQGKGVGQAMLDRAAERCREAGCGRVRLAVNKHNEKAIKAYRRHGYEVVGERVKDIGGGFVMDDFWMEEELGGGDG